MSVTFKSLTLPAFTKEAVRPQRFKLFRKGDWLRLESLIASLEGYVSAVRHDHLLLEVTRYDGLPVERDGREFTLRYERIYCVLEILYAAH